VQWLIAAIGLAAIAIPFVLPRTGEMPFSPAQLDEIPAKGRVRSIIGAAVLLAIIGVGLYSAFDLGLGHRGALALYGGFFAVLAVTVMVQGRVRALCVKVLAAYLVVIGLVIVAGGLWHLWTAAWEGRAVMPSRTYPNYWVSFREAPGRFWFSVWCGAFMQGFALYMLREYFGNWLRPVSRALPQADDEAR
jgi:hypothetical protein